MKLENKIINKEMLFDMASQVSNSSSNNLLSIATLLIIVVWAIAIIDAYRIGKQQDKQSM